MNTAIYLKKSITFREQLDPDPEKRDNSMRWLFIRVYCVMLLRTILYPW